MSFEQEQVVDIRFLSPRPMSHADVTVALESTSRADPTRDLVPSYNFGIYDPARRTRYGRISFRVGRTTQIVRYTGNIGYGIEPAFRGNGYAGKACFAIRPLVRKYYTHVVITCDPDNTASDKTIRRIGAQFIECVPVPRSNILYRLRGSTAKNRYVWAP